MKYVKKLVVVGLALLVAGCAAQPETEWPRVVASEDGTPISYEVHGTGEPTLVFVHGWSCDGRYWRAQVPYFAPDHRVVVIDLAGHGHSGQSREDYTMAAFGEDVKAVVEAEGVEQAILVGHSMGGPVSLHAAALMPEQVIGVVGVDTFQAEMMELDEKELNNMLAPMRENFRATAEGFVAEMFVENTDARLREWVIADMGAASPRVALSAMRELIHDYISGEFEAVLEAQAVPVVAINADLWPTDVAALREYMPQFEAVIVEGKDHFLHMAAPERFNRELAGVLSRF